MHIGASLKYFVKLHELMAIGYITPGVIKASQHVLVDIFKRIGDISKDARKFCPGGWEAGLD